jgi:hypothetical protein
MPKKAHVSCLQLNIRKEDLSEEDFILYFKSEKNKKIWEEYVPDPFNEELISEAVKVFRLLIEKTHIGSNFDDDYVTEFIVCRINDYLITKLNAKTLTDEWINRGSTIVSVYFKE